MRSTALTILVNPGGMPPREVGAEAFRQVLDRVGGGVLTIEVQSAPLASVGEVWNRPGDGRRLVLVP